MARRKIPYKEGDWFAVPLKCGGYALGVAARIDGRGGIIGYFFGPRLESIPTLEEIGPKHRRDAILVSNFGDLGFLEGRWKVIGPAKHWDRTEWPMPVFGKIDIISGKAWRVKYAEPDFVLPVSKEPTTPDDARSLPSDVISGSGAVEMDLSDLLCP